MYIRSFLISFTLSMTTGPDHDKSSGDEYITQLQTATGRMSCDFLACFRGMTEAAIEPAHAALDCPCPPG